MEKRRFSEPERVCSAKRNTPKHILKHRPKARAFAAIAAAALLFPQPARAASPTQNPGPACAPDLGALNLAPLFPDAPRMEYDGGTFGLEATGRDGALGRMLGRVYLTLERGCGKETREAGTSPRDLGDVVSVHYGEIRTLVVSSDAVHILPGAEIFSRPDEERVMRAGPGKITLELPAARSVLDGDALFVFEEGNNVEVFMFSEARRVSAQMPELAPDCVPVEYEGGFIFLQGGDSPVIDLRRTEDGWRHFVYDAGNFSAERLLSYRETESGVVAVFAGGDGSEVEMRISRTEGGRLAFSFR